MARRKKTDEPELEQGFIHGTEPVTIKEIDQAAKVYYNVMLERKGLSEEEDQAKDNLIDRMKNHGLQFYETKDGKIVTLTETSNLKVKAKKIDKSADDGDTEESGSAK